ncbi:MAG: hypothetical protein Q8Q59_14030 [Luteolibacter sp.]|jgi:hypothetical protein|nr:hypothetical protein [Luteolibacter sp.]
MKITLFLCALALNAAAAAQPVLVRVTPATLARLLAKDPMIRVVNTDETMAVRPVSRAINNESTVLHDGENWTLVPTGALVHLPAAMKSRINAKPVGTLLPWNEFLNENQSWITIAELTFDQAAGNEEFPVNSEELRAKQDKVIVTVHQNNPAPVRIAPIFPALTSR